MILETIHDPRDIKALNDSQTQLLCTELREFLLKNVSKTGGHLASNLGAVELTVAIHRVFDTSRDRLVFDVGHQCYTHKILTGRASSFRLCASTAASRAFPSRARAGMTPLSRDMPPTPSPSRSAWRGRGRCSIRIIPYWR